MRDSTYELLNIFSSKDPVVYVNTYEEAPLIRDIVEAVLNKKTNIEQIYVYTRPSGLYSIDLLNPDKYSEENIVKEVHNINQALEFIRSIQNNIDLSQKQNILNKLHGSDNEEQYQLQKKKTTLFIFKDLHMYLEDKDIIRYLRDLKEVAYNDTYCPILITAPLTNIPVELEKLCTYWEYPLMTKKELSLFINNILPEQYLKDKLEDIVNACCGLTELEVMKALLHSYIKNNEVNVRDIHDEKIQLVKKSGLLDYISPKYSLNDLGGCKNFKSWIMTVKESMQPEAKEFGIPTPKGAMLVGVPGTSKSASAEIMASYLNVPLLSLNMSKIMGSLVGQSERAMANALRIAKSIAPCVLLVDECEKNLGGINSSNTSDSGALARVFGSLLSFLQEDSGVIIMMTSNDVSQLPPELTRSGRIDKQWVFNLPTLSERKEIIKIYLNKSGLAYSDSKVKYIAENTVNFTGAEIKSAVKDILINSYYRQKKSGIEHPEKTFVSSDVNKAVSNTVTVWMSSKEKIQRFEKFTKNRYLNASAEEDTCDDNDYSDDISPTNVFKI